MQTDVASIALPAEPLSEIPERALSSAPIAARASVAVKVPSWFSSGAALRVAQLKGVEHLLVLDRGAVVGTVARQALSAAPAHAPLARTMVASSASVAPDTSLAEARALMASLGLDCLPMISGPLLVGLVTRGDLADDDLRAAG